jgi:acylphosphatase
MGGEAEVCRQFRVSGRVQGVCYRASARALAQRLGLRGWARNLADGDVEVVACGSPAALAELERWLWQGPAGARVTAVTSRAGSATPGPGFEVR